MHINPSSSERTYTVEETARLLNVSTLTIESLIRNEILGFEVGQYGPVITNSHLTNYYLGNKPKREPDYKPEKPKRKMPKYYVKAKTKR